jgi:hypothetical protein
LETRKRLTLEEEKDELNSAPIDPSDDFTETKYLLYGLDLEDQQSLGARGGVLTQYITNTLQGNGQRT